MPCNVLRSPWQFQRVYRDGKKIACQYTVLFYHRTGEPNGGPLFGVVASKRVGGAVQRNRAKRVLREAVRDIEHRLKIRDLWVVFVARRAILDASSEDVRKDIRNAMLGEGLIGG